MELDDKKQFLSQCPPFSALSEQALGQCLKKLCITYEKAGTVLELSNQDNDIFLLRSGSVEIKNSQGEFIDRLSSGGVYGRPLVDNEGTNNYDDQNSEHSSLTGISPIQRVVFLEDSLVYSLPFELIENLTSSNDTFASFFNHPHKTLLTHQQDIEENQPYRNFSLNQKVSELMTESPLCIHQTTTIQEAARLMSEAKVSSILLVDEGELCGILTDRDLRSRVLAKGIDPSLPVSEVMTAHPKTIQASQTVYETQLSMMTANIHHLPVIKDNKPLGIVTLNDFIRAQNSEPLYMIQAINRATNRERLYPISQQLPVLICKLIEANVRANEIGRIITSITDSITRRLIQLASQAFGPAPCQYAWVVFGSQARQDQMLGSDQDNGLILEEGITQGIRDYFQKFAEFVNEGLDRSGLKFCPGDIMAKNEKWCQPIDKWQHYFTRWIREPEPKALMHASIFYDIRHVSGKRELTQSLVNLVLTEAKKNTIFQACMSENALQASPPLGFFKTFVLDRDGNHNPVLDLKLRGTVPIVAMVRLYCLAHGIQAVNTSDRLRLLQEKNILSVSEAGNLHDAHEFIASLRLEGQSQAMMRGEVASNHLNPDELSPLVRHQLKGAFSVVAESQRLFKTRFGHGVI